jgi:hypothetical protein
MQLSEQSVREHAEVFAAPVRQGGYNLDYSIGSIAILENLLCHDDVRLREANFPEAQRNLVVFYNGCYLGEVLRQNLGGMWIFEPNWFDSTLLFPLVSSQGSSQGGGGLQTQPFVKVYRRLTEDPPDANDFLMYFHVLQEKLREQTPKGWVLPVLS